MNSRKNTAVVFVLLGLCALMAAALLRDHLVVSGALVNVGVVFISIVLLTYVWSQFGGEPTENLLADVQQKIDRVEVALANTGDQSSAGVSAQRAGLISIATRSDDHLSPAEWRDLLAGARTQVDLAGTAHHGWLRDGEFFQTSVEKGVREGCLYRVLLYAPLLADSPPTSPLASILSDEQDRSEATTGNNRAALRFYKSVAEQVRGAGPGRFELKVLDRKVLYAITSRFDDRLLIAPYLFHARSEGSPLLDVRNNGAGLFRLYADEFERLWTRSGRPLTSEEQAAIKAPANSLHSSRKPEARRSSSDSDSSPD